MHFSKTVGLSIRAGIASLIPAFAAAERAPKKLDVAEHAVSAQRKTAREEGGTDVRLAQAKEQNPPASSASGGFDDKLEMLEEIIVTAQKREERLQDIPMSVAVLQGANLEQSGVRGIADVLNQVGGVYLQEAQPGRSTISIRGASAGLETLTGSSAVGYYLDEVPFSFVRDAFVPDANAFDLERVEVLRGPQGTLYGANSLNGVVRVITRDANLDEFEVKGRLRYGSSKDSEDSMNGDMAVNIPVISGKLGVRAVASYADLGGFISTATTQDFNDSTIQNYRLKINAVPTERLDIELGAWASRIDNDGSSEGDAGYFHPFSDDQKYERDYEVYNITVAYELPFGSVQSSTGYIDLRGVGAVDFSLLGTPVNLIDNLSSESFTEEVRFASKFLGPWQVTGGVFYRTAEDTLQQAVFEFFPFPTLLPYQSESYAVFGEVTRLFLEGKLKLTGGLRYFEDTVKSQEKSTLFNGTGGPFIPDANANFDALTYRATAAYRSSADFIFYASVGTGFRSGFNQDAVSRSVEPGLPPVDADDLTTYEIGSKGALFNGHVFYDSAAYYTKWDGSQQITTTSIDTIAVFNADSVSGVGVDANVHAAVSDRLSINGSIGWNNLEFDSDVFRGDGVTLLYPQGSRPGSLPEITGSLGAEYRFPISGRSLHGFLAGNAYYNSQRTATGVGAANAIVVTKSDAILNGQLRAGIDSDQWTVSVFADNVTNETGAVYPNSAELPMALRLRPRTIGLQVTFDY